MELKCLSNLKTIEDVHEWLNRCAEVYQNLDHNERLNIDLSELRWVSPVGMSALVSTLNKLSARYDIKTIIPDNDNEHNLIGYLERMDFFKVCPEEVKEAFEFSRDMAQYYNRNRTDQKNGLVELRTTSDYPEVGPLQKAIRDIMKGKGLAPNRVSDIASIIGELAGNSIEHAKTDCFPCVQYYPNRANKQVEIAISDYGKGIVRSLRKYVNYSTYHELVEKAITTRATSLKDEDRGLGLMEVKQRTFDWSKIAKFYLRTHDSAYRVYPDKVELIDKGRFFFGTYYYITIDIGA